MGLKIRRLKHGFAFYGEYKFGSGTGRQNCIYERVEAESLREAKKKYAERRAELLAQLRDGAPAPLDKPITVRESGASKIDSMLASILRILATRGAFADPALGELVRNLFKQIDRAESSSQAMEICARVRGELLTRVAPARPRANSEAAISVLMNDGLRASDTEIGSAGKSDDRDAVG